MTALRSKRMMALITILILAATLACSLSDPVLGGNENPTKTPYIVSTAQAPEPTNTPAAPPVEKPTEVHPTDEPKSTPIVISAPTGTVEQADPIPANAVALQKGDTLIPNWGYGPHGVKEVEYPNVFPGGLLTMGAAEAKTDFNGNNWVSNGCWTWKIPEAASEISVTVQGDTPAEVTWEGNTLKACSSGAITRRAQDSVENGTPRPAKGSSGFSLVLYIK